MIKVEALIYAAYPLEYAAQLHESMNALLPVKANEEEENAL